MPRLRPGSDPVVTRLIALPEVDALRDLRPDGRLLFFTRAVRMFAYGFLSITLALYLARIGLSEGQIGLLLTLSLVGDALLALAITLAADRVGRRRMLLLGAGMMFLGGAVFALTSDVVLLMVGAFVGTISPSGKEVGPFLSIEQAMLAQAAPGTARTPVLAWYNLVGSLATACGALGGGWLAQALQTGGSSPESSYRAVVIVYAGLSIVLAVLFTRLSPAVEVGQVIAATVPTRLGLHRSQRVVFRLSALFMLDAFAGGLIIQSLIAYWFFVRFGVPEGELGGIFFAANLLAAFSALAAVRIAARIGLVNTMVFTHLPSNVLLILVPFMPSLGLAVGLLLVRFSISQMDVPTRQSYILAVVAPDERSAAAGVTTIARTVGSAVSPLLTGVLLSASLLACRLSWPAV